MAKEKEIGTKLWQMNVDTALNMFLIVKFLDEHGAEDTPELREYVLDWLGKQGLMDRVYTTKRSNDQVVEDLIKKGFNIRDTRGEDETL